MRKLILIPIVILVMSAGFSSSQTLQLPQPPAVDPELASLPVTSMLYHLAGELGEKAYTGPYLAKWAAKRGLAISSNGLVNVEIVNRNGDDPVQAYLVESHGGTIDAVWRGQTSAWIPPEEAASLAGALPEGFLLRHASLAVDNNEGPVTMGSDSYVSPGPAGAGMIVGIMDRNYVKLTEAQNLGHAPADAIRHNYNAGGFESGEIVHGTAHTETVFDHVPNAEFHLFRIGNSTHLGTAINDAITLGVNVISATQSFYNEGWDDDTGAAAQAVAHAANNGILYVSSAGNRGLTHWQGSFTDDSGNSWHEWANGGETNSMGSRDTTKSVSLYLQWDRSQGYANYDLYLYDGDGNTLGSSTSGGEIYEQIGWVNNSLNPVDVRFGVRRVSGAAVEFEVFEINSPPFADYVPESSLTSPNNNSAPNCLVMGAVPYSNYSDGHLEGYSSRGPTNSGARGIDLVGPTNTWAFAYVPKRYGGTSCSTPNTAGAIAALWATNPELSADGIRLLVTHMAAMYNDWGVPGPDTLYGYGGAQLPDFVPLTVWMDRAGGNTAGLATLPWYYVIDGILGSDAGELLRFLGGFYPEPVVMDQPRTMKSVLEPAVLGTGQ